jgi:hypothetical protein
MRPWPALALILPLAAGVPAHAAGERGDAADRSPEAPVTLPAYPGPENYLPFEVSATTPFAFFVDANSIGVGADGEVRYTVIAKSPSGALNVSFEGMRCNGSEFRIYALGRSDGSWSKARDSKWQVIRLDPRNAQRSVLFEDYFCTTGGNITSGAEGARALRNGGNPRAAVKAY